MQNGKVLFVTSSLRQGLSLEGLAGFTLDVGLQLNTAPGVYAIETVVFDRKRGRLIANGPWVNVTVHEGKSFAGEVQMNPEMVLRSPTPADERGTLSCSALQERAVGRWPSTCCPRTSTPRSSRPSS